MRINKMLSNYGHCSRKDARIFIEDLRLRINGELATQGQWVEETDLILLDGKPLFKKPSLYYLYHKPKGILSTMDTNKQNSLYHILDSTNYIYPVGRLDQDSEGLLLLTNDGELTQRILSPRFNHEKEYLVTVNKKITPVFREHMSHGVDINIGITKPCQVEQVSDLQFRITLTQGLNRQIRRMCAALGYQVTRLIRLRILNLHLDELPSGDCRPLNGEELNQLMETLQMD